MFSGCTSLTSAPALPATTLAGGCYYGMFEGCTGLTTAPELLAVDITEYGQYKQMFEGCSKLNYVKAMFTRTPDNRQSTHNPTYNWVNGVAASGTFVKNANAEWDIRGTYAIPEGWNVITVSE